VLKPSPYPCRVRFRVPGDVERVPPYKTDARVTGTLAGWLEGPVMVAVIWFNGRLVFREFHECEVVSDG
jgi:hypothetical protein